jgi:ABC-type multidrug transport system permease subunit
MRWLALKDLRILRRSPLLVGLLIVYPIVLSLVVGKAVDAGPSKPKVAVVNEIPPSETTFRLGNETIDANRYANQLFESIDPIRVKTRAEAIAKVRSGEALAALIVPADITDRLQGAINLSGGPRPTVDVVYSNDDPLKTRFVQSAINARIADANRVLTQKLTGVAANYLKILLRGGSFNLLGSSFDVLGLQNAARIVEAVLATRPANDPDRQALERVARFAKLAIDNLDLSDQVLGTLGSPIQVNARALSGGTSSDAFFFSTALAISLMFVCVLLAAGLLALEREEHAFGRLVRGLVSRTGIAVEKALLAGGLGAAAATLMLAVLALVYGLDAGHVPAALAALLVGGVAFGALGVAIGGAAREVRAASLLAVLVLLPIAALGLVPTGAVSSGASEVIRVVSAAFPFRPTLRGLEAALSGTSIAGPLAHLAALAVAYTALARLALRRFA